MSDFEIKGWVLYNSGSTIHEDFRRRQPARRLANRSFGVAVAAALAVMAFLPLIRGRPPRWVAFWLCFGFLSAAWLAPGILTPLQGVWFWWYRLSVTLVNLFVTTVMFYLVLTPVALLLHLTGRDLLGLKADEKAPSYWTSRSEPDSTAESMRRQY